MNVENVYNSVADGKIFSVKFIKANGDLREMVCRTGVKKHLKGGELKYNPKERNNLIVFDVQKEGYRTIKCDKIQEIKINGEVYFSK